MRWNATLTLLALTIAVGAYVSLYELRQPDPEERRERAALVFDLPSGAARITMAWPGQPEVALVHQDGAWRLEPGGFRADPSFAQGALGALRQLRASRSFTPEPAHSLETFGLQPPQGRLTITAEDGRETALRIGGLTPVPGGRYVQRDGHPEITVVDAATIQALEKPAEHFRDRAMLRMEPWSIRQAVWVDGERRLTVSQADHGWQVGDPAEPADENAVVRWLTQWSSLPAIAFVNDAAQPADVEAAALGSRRFELTMEDGSALTLSLGAPVTDQPELRYAMRSDEPAILYGVAEADLAVLRKSPEDLRKKEAPASEGAAAPDASPEAP